MFLISLLGLRGYGSFAFGFPFRQSCIQVHSVGMDGV